MAALARPCGSHVLKLCINSHVAYSVPLRTLFASLFRARFEHFPDTIVMLGGSANEATPLRVRLDELIPGSATNHSVVLVRTRANAFDYHGLSLLYRHRQHPLVMAETYLYVHDTVTVEEDTFVERFESFRLQRSPLLFTTWPLPNSNIVAFGVGVVHRFGTNFDGNLSKTAAFPMEVGQRATKQSRDRTPGPAAARATRGTRALAQFGFPFERAGHPSVQPLIAHGFVVKVGPRVPRGSSDVYGTGTPRLRFYYPAFGLFKHSMRSDTAGDIVGKKASLFHGGRRYYPPGNDSKLAKVLFASRPSCWDVGCRETVVSLGGRATLRLPACTPRLWNGSSQVL